MACMQGIHMKVCIFQKKRELQKIIVPIQQQQNDRINKMLKFIQNQSSNRIAVKPLIRYKPELVYGHTKESPSEFLNPHSIYFKNLQQNNLQQKVRPFEVVGKGKGNKQECLQNYQTFNFTTQYRNQSSRGQRNKRNKEIGREGYFQGDFNISRGQFSTFLDRHKNYGSLGTIYKQNNLRNTQSLHKLTWNKSINTEEKHSQTNSLLKSKMSFPSENMEQKPSSKHSKQMSLWMTRSNSISSLETTAKKNELKLKRDEFIGSMKKEVKQKLQKKYENFGLPRLGVEHQLFFIEKVKQGRTQTKSEMEQLNGDLDKFEHSLNYKFK